MSDNSDDMEGYSDTMESLENSMEFLDVKAPEQFEMLLEKIIADAKSNLQNNGSVVTGELLASVRVLDRLGDLDAVVGSDSDHAWYVENGRAEVRPIHAKALHWISKETGEDVFSKYAGPAEPRPFLEPAVIDNTEDFPEIFVQWWSDVSNGVRDLR